MHRPAERTAGFSLAEALVAVAIAAVLAVVLTRFVSNTRLNALKIRQTMAISTTSDALVERISLQGIQPGRTEGRSGSLSWRIAVAPIAFSAQTRIEKRDETSEPNKGQRGMAASAHSADDAQSEQKPVSGPEWNLYQVRTIVRAPAGQSYEVDTLRIGPAKVEQR